MDDFLRAERVNNTQYLEFGFEALPTLAITCFPAPSNVNLQEGHSG